MLTDVQMNVAVDILEGKTKTSIAEKRGCSRTLIYQWLKDAEFQDYIKEQSEKLNDSVDARLKYLADMAIERMHQLLNSKSEHVQVKVINSILDRSGHAPEVSIKQELTKTDNRPEQLTENEIARKLAEIKSKNAG